MKDTSDHQSIRYVVSPVIIGLKQKVTNDKTICNTYAFFEETFTFSIFLEFQNDTQGTQSSFLTTPCS